VRPTLQDELAQCGCRRNRSKRPRGECARWSNRPTGRA
jgi:hypothetical protein